MQRIKRFINCLPFTKKKRFDIEIIEARDRIGGRIHTVYSDAGQVEMGATWFNDIHVSFRNLLSELDWNVLSNS
jgi:monoamine oxidase